MPDIERSGHLVETESSSQAALNINPDIQRYQAPNKKLPVQGCNSIVL
jgi:hypothetical protein